MTAFDRLCTQTINHDASTEDVRTPTQDAQQDAWLSFLKTLFKRDGELPQASTSEELAEAYSNDAGLLVVKSKRATIDNARRVKGARTSRKHTRLAQTLSLDQMHEQNDFDTIEDQTSEDGFRRVEAQEALSRLIASATRSERAALGRFVRAFSLQERGEPIPRALAQALSVDRQRYGFAFALRKGRA